MTTSDWEAQVAAIWATAAEREEHEVLALIDAVVATRPETDAAALFEAASARDYVGRESEAEPLYRDALRRGLAEPRHSQAVIQLASTLRNLGRFDDAIDVLRDGFAHRPDHELADVAAAFVSLTLASKGDTLSATVVALETLARRLPAYRNAIGGYAAALLET